MPKLNLGRLPVVPTKREIWKNGKENEDGVESRLALRGFFIQDRSSKNARVRLRQDKSVRHPRFNPYIPRGLYVLTLRGNVHGEQELRSGQVAKKQEAVAAYEEEAGRFVDMGTALPELDDERRVDVEIAVAEMEREQEWLMGAEDILVARQLQNTVEDDVKEKLAGATTQLLEAQSRIAEWQAEDERRARDAQEAAEAEARRAQEVRDTRRRDALAAEERRRAAQRPQIVSGSGTIGSGSTTLDRPETEKTLDVIEIPSEAEDDSTPAPRTRKRASAIRAGKRKMVESDGGEPETTPRAKRLRKRTGNAEDANEKTPPPPPALDVMEYGEYDPADASASPNNVNWGCGFGTPKESCPHPIAHYTCVGTGCHACEACTGSKVRCSHAKTRARPVKTSDAEPSGSKVAGGRGKQRTAPGPKTRRRAREGRETTRTTRAATGSALMPILAEVCADHELRTIVQVMASMDARIAALKQATEEAESTRAAATRSIAALILRRELEEAQRAEEADEEEREEDRRREEDAEYDGA
ncbi:hypothetical protein PLEOSDRAFT_1086878 [Pleurotus ostreatus PC15]|uniref:Uncharacterized protein n=1 Tax=Pleurotus ostreatus (strain PC15) TaxID=1137138 RepID=A0A067N2N3_PLEO1|nr:hypothetical protein PLEOSDRAFT_1086878 [Pleurotus ostreatus PC15]